LISIDVNSARATKGGDIEETAFHTNLEAVEEVARQLRIRDIGGLVVIDLIDMTVGKNQRSVENRLKEALRPDRARVQVGKISRFGLLEMSRQRLRASISDSNYRVCPRCDGTGTIRSVVSSSLNLLRLIEDEALKENTEAIQVALPLDMATYLLNEKRHELYQLEARLASRVIIVPSDELASPHFELNRLRSEELDQLSGIPSYKQEIKVERQEQHPTEVLKSSKPTKPSIEIDQISHVAPPAPQAAQTVQPQAEIAAIDTTDAPGLLQRIARSLFGAPGDSSKSTEADSEPPKSDSSQRQSQTGDAAGRQKNQQRGRRDRKPSGTRQGQAQGRRSEQDKKQTPPRKTGDNQGKRKQGQGNRGQQARGDGQQTRGQQRRKSDKPATQSSHPNRNDPQQGQKSDAGRGKNRPQSSGKNKSNPQNRERRAAASERSSPQQGKPRHRDDNQKHNAQEADSTVSQSRSSAAPIKNESAPGTRPPLRAGAKQPPQAGPTPEINPNKRGPDPVVEPIPDDIGNRK
jgi:ribonuclease E